MRDAWVLRAWRLWWRTLKVTPDVHLTPWKRCSSTSTHPASRIPHLAKSVGAAANGCWKLRTRAADVFQGRSDECRVGSAGRSRWARQNYRQEAMRGAKWYEPTDFGYDKTVKERME